MPECTKQERSFLDQLKRSLREFASSEEWEPDDDVALYFIEDEMDPSPELRKPLYELLTAYHVAL